MPEITFSQQADGGPAPRITVTMPVLNGGQHLRLAILSIVGQTCQDWELLIIDEGSTDNALQGIPAIHDRQIRILRDGKNKRLAVRLNTASDRHFALSPFRIKAEIFAPEFPRSAWRSLLLRVTRRLNHSGARMVGRPCFVEKPFNFDPRILGWNALIYLDGYFQSEKYFLDFRQAIVEDMRLMAACQRFVIANSSLSWWGRG